MKEWECYNIFMFSWCWCNFLKEKNIIKLSHFWFLRFFKMSAQFHKMVLLAMRDKRLTRPLIIDYFDNSNLLTSETHKGWVSAHIYIHIWILSTSVSLYFPSEFKLQDIKGEMKTVNHQPMTHCGFTLQRTSLTFILPPPPPPPIFSLRINNDFILNNVSHFLFGWDVLHAALFT